MRSPVKESPAELLTRGMRHANFMRKHLHSYRSEGAISLENRETGRNGRGRFCAVIPGEQRSGHRRIRLFVNFLWQFKIKAIKIRNVRQRSSHQRSLGGLRSPDIPAR
jgi:hypothetical protein